MWIVVFKLSSNKYLLSKVIIIIYYISDMHIGHKNAIRFDNRPFNDIDEMECEIINRWNNKVNSNDDVYILGDVFYRY